ncbi:MAG: histone deacetylase [Thermodesulfovibrionales bacterium]|nr:histone deacetylase [Thermodesulfovibrionales bacterium]
MRKTALIYDDIFLKHKTQHGHPERPERLVSIMNTLRDSDIWDSLIHLSPRKATDEELLAVHTPGHIEHMKNLVGYADPDTYVSEDSLEAALYAAGAVLVAIDRCRSGEIERAFCAVRPPGHHAEADRAMGFCMFNNVAVGARYAQKLGYKRIFIIDFDVHHGNGTQHMFYDDPDVFYFSTHQWPHYPGTGRLEETGTDKGAGTTANFPMDSGAGLKEYAVIYNDILPKKVASFDPDMIIVSAGYDLHVQDPLSGIRITDEGINTIVSAIVRSKDIPAVFALEGGYDLDALSASVLTTIKNLLSE